MSDNIKQSVKRHLFAFTLIELMLVIVTALIVGLTVGIVMSGSYSSWNIIYQRIYGDMITDADMATTVFDSICRKSSDQRCLLDTQGKFVEVYYYDDMSNFMPDKYANFYLNGQDLLVDYGNLQNGTWNPLPPLSTVRLARHVQDIDFLLSGDALTMILSLQDGTQTMTSVCSSVRHND